MSAPTRRASPAHHTVRDAQEAAFLAGVRTLTALERKAFIRMMQAMVADSRDLPAAATEFLELRGWPPSEIAAQLDEMQTIQANMRARA